MARLILHIGMHKTGTTTIQTTLRDHPTELESLGLRYLDLSRNHSIPLVSLFRRSPETYEQNRARGRTAPEAIAAFQEDVRTRLERELRACGDRTMIISGESIALHLDADETRTMLDHLGRYFDDIRVLAFIRPPASFATSAFQQRVKARQTVDRLLGRPVKPRYRQRFEKYLELLPPGAFRLMLYHRPHFPEGCVVRAFLDAVGVPPEAFDRFAVSDVNLSLSQPAVALLLAVNALYPNLPDGRRNPDWPARITQLARGTGGPRFRLPAEVVSRTLAESARDAQWMSRQLGCDLREFDAPVDDGVTIDDLQRLDSDGAEAVADLARRRDAGARSQAGAAGG